MLISYSTWKFVVSDKKKQATKRTFWFRCKHQRACQQVISHMVKHCMPCYTVGQTRSEPEKILFIIYILFMATSLSVLFHCISASWHSSLYHMTHHLQRACSCWSNTRVININFLLTITIHYQRNGYEKYWNDHQENASTDLLTNSLFSLFPWWTAETWKMFTNKVFVTEVDILGKKFCTWIASFLQNKKFSFHFLPLSWVWFCCSQRRNGWMSVGGNR